VDARREKPGDEAFARVSAFAIATCDTDYMLIPDAQKAVAIAALEAAELAISAGTWESRRPRDLPAAAPERRGG
jgi:hypothetical protein